MKDTIVKVHTRDGREMYLNANYIVRYSDGLVVVMIGCTALTVKFPNQSIRMRSLKPPTKSADRFKARWGNGFLTGNTKKIFWQQRRNEEESFSDKRSGDRFPVLVYQRHAARTLRVRWGCKCGA